MIIHNHGNRIGIGIGIGPPIRIMRFSPGGPTPPPDLFNTTNRSVRCSYSYGIGLHYQYLHDVNIVIGNKSKSSMTRATSSSNLTVTVAVAAAAGLLAAAAVTVSAAESVEIDQVRQVQVQVQVQEEVTQNEAINAESESESSSSLPSSSSSNSIGDERETLSNIPQMLSGENCVTAKDKDCRKPRIQKPKSRKAERCTGKCVTICIRGGEGEGPFNIIRPLVVFKEGFRSRRYCLVECSDICNLIGDGDDGQ